MQYDIIGNGVYDDKSKPEFFTIGNLIELCLEHLDKTFRFVGTEYTVGYLHSWRGSYDLPAISYLEGECTGKEISECLLQSLTETHYGWKGGEYKYTRNDDFYVSEKGSAHEYKVCGYEVKGNEVILLTKLDPY